MFLITAELLHREQLGLCIHIILYYSMWVTLICWESCTRGAFCRACLHVLMYELRRTYEKCLAPWVVLNHNFRVCCCAVNMLIQVVAHFEKILRVDQSVAFEKCLKVIYQRNLFEALHYPSILLLVVFCERMRELLQIFVASMCSLEQCKLVAKR